MKRMLSAIKPTGELTLGNYLGALKNFVKYQDDYEMFVFIANLHCITVYQEPKLLNKYLKDAIALYLAAGLDPQQSTIFLQSDVLEHSQLGFILSCNTYLGELNRMTQYKDKKSTSKEPLSVGFYTYPTLMAADIILYDADFVPVGIDQKQHVELARDLSIRFNNKYGKTFTIPEPKIESIGNKIMSLTNPTKKMSKSDQDTNGCIYLLEDLKSVTKKIMSATTDSLNNIQYDPENQPGISNLLTIYSSITGFTIDETVQKFNNEGYGTFKKAVAAEVVTLLEKIQQRYKEIIDSNLIDEVLKAGAIKAKNIASTKLKLVQEKIGIEI